MANIDYKVRLLTDLLMDRGLGWLAAEIIETIEAGKATFDERDHNVKDQRIALNANLDAPSGSSRHKEMPDESSVPEDAPREEFSPEIQVTIAVDLLIQRLSGIGQMLMEGQQNLELIFDTHVSLSTEISGELHELNPQGARGLTLQLEQLREELSQWLMHQTSES
jgi:hypothetical protein